MPNLCSAIRGTLGQRQIRQCPGLALNDHSGNDWGPIPVLTGYDLVRLKMREKDLERKTKDVSVNESWNLLKKSLDEVIEETIPRAVGMIKKRPWVTRKVQKKEGRSKEFGEHTVS